MLMLVLREPLNDATGERPLALVPRVMVGPDWWLARLRQYSRAEAPAPICFQRLLSRDEAVVARTMATLKSL